MFWLGRDGPKSGESVQQGARRRPPGHEKATLGLAKRPHSLLVPRVKRGRKGEKTVTEKIKSRQTAEETSKAVESSQLKGAAGVRALPPAQIPSQARPGDFQLTMTVCGAISKNDSPSAGAADHTRASTSRSAPPPQSSSANNAPSQRHPSHPSSQTSAFDSCLRTACMLRSSVREYYS